MIDFTKCTFLIPFMNSCPDRLFNLKSVLSYMNTFVKTNIIVIEQVSVNQNSLFFDNYPNLNIEHFVKNIDASLGIHKTLLYNIGISNTKTDVLVTLDSDVLIPIKQLQQSINFIQDDGYDYSYPFDMPCVEIAKQFYTERNHLLKFYDFDNYLSFIKNKQKEQKSLITGVPPGGCMVLNKKAYIECGMENENFIGYAPEDAERKYRLEILGYKNKNANGHIFHIEHNILKNGRVSSKKNNNIFNYIKKLSPHALKKYYETLNYKNKYGIKL